MLTVKHDFHDITLSSCMTKEQKLGSKDKPLLSRFVSIKFEELQVSQWVS